MRFREWQRQIESQDKTKVPRAALVASMCIERGITDARIIHEYILKSYKKPTTEFVGRRIRSSEYANRQAHSALVWIKDNVDVELNNV